MAELLKKIPAEMCWLITAQALTGTLVVRGEKMLEPIVGKEKWQEINFKAWSVCARLMCTQIKETLKIPVKDAGEAAKLHNVVASLLTGPEFTAEIVKETRERAVVRVTKCAFNERYKEFDVNPELIYCEPTHQVWAEEGLKAINPKITCKLTKGLPRGDPYCEFFFEFKET